MILLRNLKKSIVLYGLSPGWVIKIGSGKTSSGLNVNVSPWSGGRSPNWRKEFSASGCNGCKAESDTGLGSDTLDPLSVGRVCANALRLRCCGLGLKGRESKKQEFKHWLPPESGAISSGARRNKTVRRTFSAIWDLLEKACFLGLRGWSAISSQGLLKMGLLFWKSGSESRKPSFFNCEIDWSVSFSSELSKYCSGAEKNFEKLLSLAFSEHSRGDCRAWCCEIIKEDFSWIS